jgi:tetratricopeptide (TPR) repeat protein
VGAELGILGLIALGTTLWLIWRALRRNLNLRPDPLYIGSATALVGFATHHLLDLPAMMPAIFVTMLIILAVTITPHNPQPISLRSRHFAWAASIVAALVLIVTGLFGSLTYSNYYNVLSRASAVTDRMEYRLIGYELDLVIVLDPANPAYYDQQGKLYLLEGSPSLATQSFQNYVELAPEYSFGWANLAVSYYENQQYHEALSAIQRAADLAPEMRELDYPLAIYAETAGDLELARATYQAMLAYNPDLVLLPSWNFSPLRTELAETVTVSPNAQITLALVNEEPFTDYPIITPEFGYQGQALTAIVAYERGELSLLDSARNRLSFAQPYTDGDEWLDLVDAWVAWREEDQFTYNADTSFEARFFAQDYPLLENINYIQFMRLAYPRMFVANLPATGDPLFYLLQGYLIEENLNATLGLP